MIKTKSAMTIAFIVVLAIIAIVSVIGIVSLDKKSIVLQGQIETDQIRISGKLPGRIEKYLVEEGQYVKAGDTLVVISSPEAHAKYFQAQSMEDVAKAQNQKVDRGTREQIKKSFFELWQKTKADLNLATKTHQRIEKLYSEGVVTQQKRDEVEALYQSAIAAEKAASYQYQMAVDGAQIEDKEAAQSLVNVAKGSVEEVQAILSDSKLVAPADGEISQKYLKVGELAGQGAPIMNLVVLENAYVIFNVREDYMPHFKMGDIIKGDIPALALKDVEFKINYISPLGSFATWKSTKQSGSYDMKTFEIHAHPTQPVENLRPGMSVLTTLTNAKK